MRAFQKTVQRYYIYFICSPFATICVRFVSDYFSESAFYRSIAYFWHTYLTAGGGNSFERGRAPSARSCSVSFLSHRANVLEETPAFRASSYLYIALIVILNYVLQMLLCYRCLALVKEPSAFRIMSCCLTHLDSTIRISVDW